MDSVDEAEQDGDAYVNEEWGFRVPRPDSSWGISAVSYEQIREFNGLRAVEVWMVRDPLADGAAFSPTLFIKPIALTGGTSVTDLVASLDSDLRGAFSGYAVSDSLGTFTVSDSSAEWQFLVPTNSSQNFLSGTRFFVATLLHGNECYLLLGNGTDEDFPIESYRWMASQLTFLD